jgi:hypothetical protein
VNNVDTLAEDKAMVLSKVVDKVQQMDRKKLARAVRDRANASKICQQVEK